MRLAGVCPCGGTPGRAFGRACIVCLVSQPLTFDFEFYASLTSLPIKRQMIVAYGDLLAFFSCCESTAFRIAFLCGLISACTSASKVAISAFRFSVNSRFTICIKKIMSSLPRFAAPMLRLFQAIGRAATFPRRTVTYGWPCAIAEARRKYRSYIPAFEFGFSESLLGFEIVPRPLVELFPEFLKFLIRFLN